MLELAAYRRGRPRTNRLAAPLPAQRARRPRSFAPCGSCGLRGECGEIGRRLGFAGIGSDAEVRLEIQVHQRRRRTVAFQIHVRSAQLNGKLVRRPIGMVRAVARRTRLLPGRGQRRVEENLLAELRNRAQRRDRRTREYNGIRIRTRQVFHDSAHAGRYSAKGRRRPMRRMRRRREPQRRGIRAGFVSGEESLASRRWQALPEGRTVCDMLTRKRRQYEKTPPPISRRRRSKSYYPRRVSDPSAGVQATIR